MSMGLLLAAMALVGVGLCTQLYVGDEVFHYRLARAIHAGPWRPVHDPLIHSSEAAKFEYVNAALWHTLLALVWKLTGVSLWVAQAYHAAYYVLMVVSTYLLAKVICDDRETGLYSAIVVATAPMMVSFSILLYMDVPVTAMSVCCLLLLARGRYGWAGVVLGLAFLTKRNAYLLAPACVLLSCYCGGPGVKARIRSGVYFLVPLTIVVLPDLYLRYQRFGTLTKFREIGPLYANPLLDRNWLVAGAADPLNWIGYFGVLLLPGMVLYVVRRAYGRGDIVLWMSIAGYALFYLVLFRGWYDVRYLAPLTPFLAILAAKGWGGIRHRYLKGVILGIGLLQLATVSHYVALHRQIPAAIEEGFEYVRRHTPVDARIMYPEMNIAEWTGRPMIWHSGISLVELPFLFWEANADQAVGILNRYGIDYILVKKSRTYDDAGVRHLGGYPRSFVNRLPTCAFLKLAFHNEELELWEMDEELKTKDKRGAEAQLRLRSTLP